MTTIEVVLGDIASMQVDAIVTAANESLLGGGGVDGPIHRAAGPRLAQAGAAIAPCDPGDAKATPAFDLNPPVRHIIHTVGPVWGMVIRSFAFVRKEVVEIFRQPRLIALLVLGPFALLLLFGAGYAQNVVQKKALFVGPPGSIYEDVHDSYQGELAKFLQSEGMIADEDEARARLLNGDVDIVVIFPPDPESDVLAGRRATITVLHDEIDPIRSTAMPTGMHPMALMSAATVNPADAWARDQPNSPCSAAMNGPSA